MMQPILGKPENAQFQLQLNSINFPFAATRNRLAEIETISSKTMRRRFSVDVIFTSQINAIETN